MQLALRQIIVMSLLFAGCAHANVRPQPVQDDTISYCNAKCFNYPNFDISICVTCWERVQRECGRDKDGAWDSGKKRQAGEPVGACFDSKTRTIWLNKNTPELCLHELAHADGSWSDKVCGKYFTWPEDMQ